MERMAERLEARRRQEFVGRKAELALFADLARDGDNGAVVFVSGPGGVGKSTLLRQFEQVGAEVGRHVVRLDGRELVPIPSTFLAAVAEAAGCDPAQDPTAAIASLKGLLLLVDTAELLTPLERWLREELLPGLGADALTVLAGREPPTMAWRTDPGWRGLVHAIRLENLSPADSRSLLDRRGVPEQRQAEALAFTRGHPLALSLVADVVAQGAEPFEPAATPEVVGALLACLVDTVPSALHRRALEACAQVLTTTESLLTSLLGLPDAHELFEWLRGLSIVETGPQGLFPHDVARDALVAELRWRHAEQYAEIHQRAGAYYREQFNSVPPAEQQGVLVDYVFLHRDNPVLGPFVTGSAGSGMDLRSLVATPVTEDERPLAAEIVERFEGLESAELLGFWMDRQPGCTLLVRGPDGDVLGLVTTLALQHATPEERRRDLAVDKVCAVLDTLPELAAGEVAGFFRFWMQRDGYQELGPVQMFITLHFVRYYLSTPGLGYSFVYYSDPDLWADICAYADVARLAQADFAVGGREYGVYWHDWKRRPPLAWLEILGEREVAREPLDVQTEAAAPPVVPSQRLSEEDFAVEVKKALKGFSRAGGLRSSPLLHTALVASHLPPDADERSRADLLRDRIRDAAARLEESPRDRRAYRALHHTYLQPAPTQVEAAELLDLPMSTYRRHLATGIERLTEILRVDERDHGGQRTS